MAVVAPTRKKWQLEKLENFDDPGWIETLQLQLTPPLTLQKYGVYRRQKLTSTLFFFCITSNFHIIQLLYNHDQK